MRKKLSRKTIILLSIPAAILIPFGIFMLSWFTLFGPAGSKGGTLDPGRLNDGVYEGRYRSGPNRAVVDVTIKEGKITGILVRKNVGSWIGKRANPAVPERIIACQSTDVDAVTGATHSSRVIMNAVANAVEKSYAATSSQVEQRTEHAKRAPIKQ